MVEVTDLGTTSAAGNNTIDVSNPFYIHPSDNPSPLLVQAVFDGTGYRSWRRGVMRSLSVKNKLGFINGEIRKPTLNSPLYRQWERCDNMVTSWILNSLGKEIADSVDYVCDAVELWKELEDRYDQTNGAKLYQIQKEINDLSQGVLDITVYYTRMKKLWEELNNLCARGQCSCVCTCGGKESMHKAEQDRRLIQFLMGLNEVYTVIRGSILMMNPLPSMAQAFALLVQEEKQREFKPNNQMFAEASSMNSSMNPSMQASSSGSSGRKQQFKTNYSPNGNQNGRSRLFCDYCRRPGHIREKCFKLHGYPQSNNHGGGQNHNGHNSGQNHNGHYQNSHNNPNYNSSHRSAKGKGLAANAFGLDIDHNTGESSGCSSNPSPNITKDQYGQLMSLLQQFQLSNAEGTSEDQIAHGAANFAGPFNEEASGSW